jgi:hypothetical protein
MPLQKTGMLIWASKFLTLPGLEPRLCRPARIKLLYRLSYRGQYGKVYGLQLLVLLLLLLLLLLVCVQWLSLVWLLAFLVSSTDCSLEPTASIQSILQLNNYQLLGSHYTAQCFPKSPYQFLVYYFHRTVS